MGGSEAPAKGVREPFQISVRQMESFEPNKSVEMAVVDHEPSFHELHGLVSLLWAADSHGMKAGGSGVGTR